MVVSVLEDVLCFPFDGIIGVELHTHCWQVAQIDDNCCLQYLNVQTYAYTTLKNVIDSLVMTSLVCDVKQASDSGVWEMV